MIGICPFFAQATSSQPSIHPFKKMEILILATLFESSYSLSKISTLTLSQKLAFSRKPLLKNQKTLTRLLVVAHQENNLQQLKDLFLKLPIVPSPPQSRDWRKKEKC